LSASGVCESQFENGDPAVQPIFFGAIARCRRASDIGEHQFHHLFLDLIEQFEEGVED
jgi:hypothetical protein